MVKMNLSEKDALAMLQKIDAGTDNSTKLKEFLKPESKQDKPAAVDLSDDDVWVETKWKEAKPLTGDALECFLCHKTFTELGCGACYDCFKVWALECKPKKKKRRKHGNQHAGNDRSL
jgi:protein-arginine kinase activator protein McsA